MMEMDNELIDLVSEGRAAMAAPIQSRVSACFEVLPRLVDALDRISLYQTELRHVRSDLTAAVRKLREEVWKAQKVNPDCTYNNANVHAALIKVNEILGKLDRLIFTDDALNGTSGHGLTVG